MSDLLIKGMKMPKNCGCCPLAVGGRFTFTCMRLFGREYTYELAEQRQEDCPLKELPEHGDLVDRKEVIKLIKHFLKIAERDDRNESKHDIAILLGGIYNIPTILEASK